jgi:hypothetical protein
MFGRQSKLPIDQMFEVYEPETTLRKSHKEFVSEWHRSMKEAFEIAQENIEKTSSYNKKNYDKRAKAVDLAVGDRVLMRNVRERGGNGKLRNHWESTIFQVIEKKDDIPVFKVKNLKKGSDVRILHRNLLMKCDDLPLDVFDDEEEKRESSPKKAKKKTNLECKEKDKLKEKEDAETRDNEEVEEQEDAVMVEIWEETTEDTSRERDEVEFADGEELELENEEENVVELEVQSDRSDEGDPEIYEVPEESESEEIETIENDQDHELEETVAHHEESPVEDASSNSDSSRDSSPQQRRSARPRKKRRVFTYDVMGGNPKIR